MVLGGAAVLGLLALACCFRALVVSRRTKTGLLRQSSAHGVELGSTTREDDRYLGDLRSPPTCEWTPAKQYTTRCDGTAARAPAPQGAC